MLERSQTVAQVVRDYSECAAVFQRYRIDFCCKGNVSVSDAAQRRGINPDVLMEELRWTIATRDMDFDPHVSGLDTPQLIDHIVLKHHDYLRRTLPFVQKLADKVSRVHGHRNPALRRLNTHVQALVEKLLPHIAYEEARLFPALRGESDQAQSVHEELASMHREHLEMGSHLEQIRDAAANFEPPEWACTSYRTLLHELKHLESDLHVHIHLENHVLMPRFTPAAA